MLTLHWWKCVFLWYIRIRERVSFKNKFFLQGGEQCPDSTTGNTVPERWVRSPVPLYSVAVVAVCLISLFCLAGVHCKEDVSKANTITGVPVLVGEPGAPAVQPGGAGRWQLSSPPAPTICPGLQQVTSVIHPVNSASRRLPICMEI